MDFPTNDGPKAPMVSAGLWSFLFHLHPHRPKQKDHSTKNHSTHGTKNYSDDRQRNGVDNSSNQEGLSESEENDYTETDDSSNNEDFENTLSNDLDNFGFDESLTKNANATSMEADNFNRNVNVVEGVLFATFIASMTIAFVAAMMSPRKVPHSLVGVLQRRLESSDHGVAEDYKEPQFVSAKSTARYEMYIPPLTIV